MSVLIESIGVYLPERILTNEEVVEACAFPEKLPIELLTGIQSRHTTAGLDFSLDLAKKATKLCFQQSKYAPNDIDLVICANISRYDEANKFFFEPNTATRLQKELNITKALTFDISNACAGLFTAIKVAKVLMDTSVVGKTLIVCGEYITHLTRSAQKEIEDWKDPLFACLTLGDSGLALILERSPHPDQGFLHLDLATLGKHSALCVAKANPTDNGGAVMYTQSMRIAQQGIEPTIKHAIQALATTQLPLSDIDFFIPHQTSYATIYKAWKAFNKLAAPAYLEKEQLLINLYQRGNTSTNSHFLALYDFIREGRIKAGDKILFNITASGLTYGTAIYALDQLPTKIKKVPSFTTASEVHQGTSVRQAEKTLTSKIVSIGLHQPSQSEAPATIPVVEKACQSCLASFQGDKNDIGIIIFCGVYRSEFIMEPAIAAILADKLQINPSFSSPKSTLAFDLLNGANGFLYACLVASSILKTSPTQYALIATAEVENNAGRDGDQLLGILQGGSAVLLQAAEASNNQGFENFYFENFPHLNESLTTFAAWNDHGDCQLIIQKDSRLQQLYLNCIQETVQNYLKQYNLSMDNFAWVLSPQCSNEFSQMLCSALTISSEKLIQLTQAGLDLFSSSIPFCFHHLLENNLAKAGDRGLIISVGSGIGVGCAMYRFGAN